MDNSKSTKSYSVILIDDEIWALRGIKGITDWDSLGFNIVGEFTDSRKALDFIRANEPDLIFTDIRMPGLDGMTLIKTLKEEGISSGVVIVTAYKDFEIARQAFKNDVCDYLIKPLDRAEVIETLNKLHLMLNQKYESDFDILNYDLSDKKNLSSIDIIKYLESFSDKSIQLVSSDTDLLEMLQGFEGLSRVYLKRYKYSYVSTDSSWQTDNRIKDISFALSRVHLGFDDLDEIISELSMSSIGDFHFSANDQTAKLEEYMFINMASKISMDTLSSEFFLSKPYLFELFRNNTDTSAMNFLKNVRLSKAAMLLRTTDLNIRDIAETVGFDDNSYFSKQFKTKYGCTPEKYATAKH